MCRHIAIMQSKASYPYSLLARFPKCDDAHGDGNARVAPRLTRAPEKADLKRVGLMGEENWRRAMSSLYTRRRARVACDRCQWRICEGCFSYIYVLVRARAAASYTTWLALGDIMQYAGYISNLHISPGLYMSGRQCQHTDVWCTLDSHARCFYGICISIYLGARTIRNRARDMQRANNNSHRAQSFAKWMHY